MNHLSLPIRRTPLLKLSTSCTAIFSLAPAANRRFYSAHRKQNTNRHETGFTNTNTNDNRNKNEAERKPRLPPRLKLDGNTEIPSMFRHHLHKRDTQLAWAVFEMSSYTNHRNLNADDIASLLNSYSFQVRANVGAYDEPFVIERARRVWIELQEKYRSVGGTLWAGPEARWFSNMVLIESVAKNYQRIEELWTEYRKDYLKGDGQAWNAVISAFSKHPEYHRNVENMYEEMISLGVEVNGTTVAARIAATVHAHREELDRIALEDTEDSKGAQRFLDAVNDIIEQAFELGVENIGPAFQRLIRAVLPFRDMELVLKLYEYSQTRGVVPDLFMCNTILKAYVDSEDLEGAMSFFVEELEGKWRLIPDISTVNTILSGIGKSTADLDAMTKIWNQVQQLYPSIRRNAITYNIYIGAKLKKYPAAVSYVQQQMHLMKNDRLFPTLPTYEYLLSAIEAANQIRSYPQVLKEMQARHLSPNAKMYGIIFHGLIRQKDAVEARKIYMTAGTELGVWPEDQAAELDTLSKTIASEKRAESQAENSESITLEERTENEAVMSKTDVPREQPAIESDWQVAGIR